jgi:hypothetical protein
MQRVTISFVLLLAMLLAPAAAFAQQAPKPRTEGPNNYFTVYYNWNFGGDLFTDRGDDVTSNSGFGASLTWWGRGLFSAEVDFDYNNHFFGDDIGDNNLMSLTLGGIVGPWARAGSGYVRPYFAFGGGLLRSSIDEFTSVGWKTSKNLGLLEAGGGVLVLFTRNVGVRGDVRYRWGVGANKSEEGWGLIPNWTYLRGTVGLSLAF